MSIFAHMRIGPSHTCIPIWAAYTRMGCPYTYGIGLLNLMILACFYIRKSLFHDYGLSTFHSIDNVLLTMA